MVKHLGLFITLGSTEVQGLSFVGSTGEVCYLYPHPLWNLQNLGLRIGTVLLLLNFRKIDSPIMEITDTAQCGAIVRALALLSGYFFFLCLDISPNCGKLESPLDSWRSWAGLGEQGSIPSTVNFCNPNLDHFLFFPTRLLVSYHPCSSSAQFRGYS